MPFYQGKGARAPRKPTMNRFVSAGVLLLSAVLSSSLLAQEPSDLTLTLRAATGSNRFQVGEIIPVEAVFSSITPGRYLEPCRLFWESHFGFPQCRFSSHWDFTVTPQDGWVDFTREPPLWPETSGGPMFDIPSKDLSSQPKPFPYALTHKFRFEKPGNYRIQLKVDVGLDDESTERAPLAVAAEKPHFVTVTAEMPLEIVAADPEWQKKVIAEGIEAYRGQSPPVTDPPSAQLLRYRQATQALCNLGTPDATRALFRLLSPEHQDVQMCFAHTPHAEAAVDELGRLIDDPDAPISTNQFSLLNFLLAKLSAANVGIWPTVDQECERLISSLPRKRGPAQTASLLTALHYPVRGKSTAFDPAYDLPFSPTLINLVVTNYDLMPWDSQRWILEARWPLVRSPLMLPLVRRLAESGNGQALARWSELDPASATEFMRKEILSPAPRFSSFFLRLPEAALSSQEEAQLASHFVTLTDTRALFNAATLLQRYASKAVLLIVLPFIDAKGATWPDSVLFPALAYVLKVSPAEAEPRLEHLRLKTNKEPWQPTFFTDIGSLEPSPVLEQLAFTQIDSGTQPLTRDAIEYLRLHGSVDAKLLLWKQLDRWHDRLSESTAERDHRLDEPMEKLAPLYQLISEQSRIVADLRNALVSAQAWVLTPEDADRIQTLLKESAGSRNTTVGPGLGSFVIYSQANSRLLSPNEGPEYMNSAERLQYQINQYRCPSMRALKEKLLQFPAGSTFSFAYEFTASDHAELVEISDFLRSHGYKVSNPQRWSFLLTDSPR